MSAAPALLVEGTREFLCRHAPYNQMSRDALAFLISGLKLAYFAKDTPILAPEMGAVEHLHIVQRGLVGSHTIDSRLEPDATLGPGEGFPVGALSASGASTKFYFALQDTFCYLLARDDFTELRRQSPEFERFCTQAITETLKQSLAQLQSQYSQRAAEQQTLARPLAELIRRAPVTCAATAPLSEALEAMRAGTVRTIVVVDPDGAPAGIFTLLDLLQRVVLTGKPLSTLTAEVMSAPAVTLPTTATASDALQTMAERGLRQLIVVDERRVAGVVSERDLFSLQRVSMGQVTATLRSARNLDGLKRAADDIRHLTQSLLAQGVVAEPLTRTIAALNDALSRQVIEQTLAEHDLSGCDWCWLALGSEGRGEQTFATDQDNALVFAADDSSAVRRLRPQLLAFARTVNANLEAVGFPLCTGNVMASNPDLCLSVDEWKEKFLAWMREPTPAALLQANILFDFRPLYGNATLAEGLREWLNSYAQESKTLPAADGAERARDRPAPGIDPRLRDGRHDRAQGHVEPEDSRYAAVRRCRARICARFRVGGDRHRGPVARRGQAPERRGSACGRNHRRLSFPAAAAAAAK